MWSHGQGIVAHVSTDNLAQSFSWELVVTFTP